MNGSSAAIQHWLDNLSPGIHSGIEFTLGAFIGLAIIASFVVGAIGFFCLLAKAANKLQRTFPMNPQTLQSLAALFASMAAFLGGMYLVVTRPLGKRIDDLRGDNENLRNDLGTLRNALRTDLGALRTEMRADLSTLRAEVRMELSALRAEMNDRLGRIEDRLTAIETRLTALEKKVEALEIKAWR